MIDAGASMGMGHLSVSAEGYSRAPNLKKTISHVEQLIPIIDSMAHVKNISPRISGQAMLASSNKSIGGMLFGIDPNYETAESNLFLRSIHTGELFESANTPGVVVGEKLARNLHLKIGRKLVYTTTDINGEIVSAIERVTGIFKTGVKEIDASVIILPLERLQKTLNYQKGQVTALAIILDDQRKVGASVNTLRHILAGNNASNENLTGPAKLEVKSWSESQPDLAGMIAIDKSSNYISQILIATLVAAGILNTLLMSVLERRYEFGVMMALGMSPSTLFRLIMMESFYLALLGLIIGSLISLPWYVFMHNVGIDFSTMIGSDMEVGGVLIDPIMKITLYKESIMAILSGVFILALVSGAYPAWQAGRTPPIDSLKHH
jgi:putative ABC transport system permease protein